MQRELFHAREEAIADGMAQRRFRAQSRLQASARPIIFRRCAGRSSPIYGRTASGHPILTFPLNVLNVDARDPANVRVFFRREERLPAGFEAGMPVPRRHVMHTSDIFHAVRQLAHVAESHRRERGEANSALALAERINAKLVALARCAGGGEAVAAAMREMEAMPEIRALASAYRHMALEQLRKAYGLLERAGENGRQANILLGAACACLSSFRERLGEWRARQTFRIDAYDELRENSLRMRRDRHVQRLLEYYVEMLSGPKAFQAIGAALENHRLSDALRHLPEPIPKGREWREEARRLLRSIGQGIRESPTKKLLRGAYRLAGEGSRGDFMERMGAITRPLLVRDLPYVADELEKSNEPYLAPAIGRIRAGFAAMEALRPLDAARHFSAAAETLRKPDAQQP